MAGTILELKDACYSYRTRAQTVNAVSHVSQAFEAGLFYAVMGRSGSGKTTLLSLLAGLIGYVFKFPVLKHLDALLGGVFGIARGVFVAYVLFALVPILVTVLPFEEFEALIEASTLGSAMYHSNIVTTILQGGL